MRIYQPLSFALAALLLGCKATSPTASNTATPATNDPVIATVGGTPIHRSEFLYVYDKNDMADTASSRAKGIADYLNLYVNFKLKVKDAESLGLDTLASFKQELAGYRDQLAEPYLVDSSVVRALTREAYEHLKQEVRASHILLTVSQEAPPEDTLRVFNQISDLRKQALEGKDFNELARQHSQDPSVALQMVYPFEQAAYQTPVGSVSQPVRTRFGYHLVKVADRRPSRGKVTVAHIMVRSNPDAPEAEAQAAKQKIDEIYNRLTKQGGNWDKLCAEFSEDGNSRNKGGVLPAFSTGSTLPEFENTAFGLANAGDISQPFRTPYGWHIIKLIDRKGLETYTQLESTLRQKVTKDSRSDLNRQLLLKRLRRENQLVENAEVRKLAFAQANDSLRRAAWGYNPTDKSLPQTLFSIKNQPYSVKDFFDYVKTHQSPREKLTPAYQMQLLYDEYVNESLIKYEKAHLEDKYPDFKMLVKEYHDGILLFQRMETQVWSKSLTDTLGQKRYFEQNQDRYQWQQRVAATVYNVADNAVLTELKRRLANKPYPLTEPKYPEIAFAKNTASLTTAQKQQLDRMTEALRQDKALVLEISGHADRSEKSGTSAARIQAVSGYLTQRGVDITQFIIRDFGVSTPKSRTDARQSAVLTSRSSSSAISVFPRPSRAPMPAKTAAWRLHWPPRRKPYWKNN
ncbi:MAG: peptidylprolyl isomerase [Cytophagales bacterium]|nr:peptidylprolyl isomerase [Cytophagales bacterium]